VGSLRDPQTGYGRRFRSGSCAWLAPAAALVWTAMNEGLLAGTRFIDGLRERILTDDPVRSPKRLEMRSADFAQQVDQNAPRAVRLPAQHHQAGRALRLPHPGRHGNIIGLY
jgi:hypothetical protein